jgi:hypothetical protein
MHTAATAMPQRLGIRSRVIQRPAINLSARSSQLFHENQASEL